MTFHADRAKRVEAPPWSLRCGSLDSLRSLGMTLILFLIAASAFAHAGHRHTYMGTVTMLHGDNAFMIKTTDGKDVTVETSPKTEFTTGQGHAAKKSDVTVGARVVVKMEIDGKTAASVKIDPRIGTPSPK